MPFAAVLMLSLFSLSLFMNIRNTGRIDQMERAGSTVTAQLDQAMAQSQRLEEENEALAAQVTEAASTDASRMMDTVQEIRAASYLLAHPATRPLVLEPLGDTGDSQGVLMVGDKGKRAFLMISGMAQQPRQLPYRVWLVRNGQRVPAGQVAVDSTGWGSLTLELPEPVFQFEWVNLTMVENSGSNAGTE